MFAIALLLDGRQYCSVISITPGIPAAGRAARAIGSDWDGSMAAVPG
jgi:hypothetical protein